MNPRKLFLPILLFVLALFSFHLWAQPTVVTNPATGLTNTVITNATTIVQNLTPTPSLTSQSPAVALAMILIPLVVPLLVAVFKFFLPKLPSWTLPILATALGALLNWISTAVGGPGVGPLTATLLGAAGVGVREIIDQLKPDTKAGAATVASMVALCLFVPVFSGCNGKLANGGAYAPGTTELSTNAATGVIATNFIPSQAPDYPFAQTEIAFDFAYSTINAVFDFEENNRAMLWSISPQIKKTLDSIRPQAVQARNDYIKARIAYMANPEPVNLSTLQDVLTRVKDIATAVQAAIPPSVSTTTPPKPKAPKPAPSPVTNSFTK